MRWAKTPFARCPCTKTAIFAGAVNHLNHTNCVNHSSDKCQPALVHALTACQPLHPPPKGLQPGLCPPGATTRAAFDNHPSAVMRQKLFCPISRELSSISRTRAHTCATPPSAAKGPPTRPVLARPAPRRARPSPASRLPGCAQNFSHNLTHSLVISRVTLLHLACLSTPSTAPKMLLTSIPFETGTLPANATTESWPSRLPLPSTKYAIQRPTCSFPLARAWTTV